MDHGTFFVTQQSSIRSKLECQTFKRKHTSPVINLTSLMTLDTFYQNNTTGPPISPKARVISSSHGLDSTRPQRRSHDGTALQQSARHFTAASTHTVGWLAWCRDQSAPVFTAASATIWASRPVAVEHLQNPRCSATYRTSRRCINRRPINVLPNTMLTSMIHTRKQQSPKSERTVGSFTEL